MTENDTEIITFLPPKGDALTESSLPKDIAEASYYIIEQDVLGSAMLANEAREIVNRARCYTLGQAIRVLSERRSDMKLVIRMPEPRQQPWTNPPAILVGGRPPPGVTVRLTDKQRANLLELLKLIGFRNGNPPDQLAGIGGTWVSSLGLDIEDGDPISERPDFTHEEVRARFRPPPGWPWHEEQLPKGIRWISLKDLVPASGVRVLVKCDMVDDDGKSVERIQEDELEADEFWKFNARHVTHWAELPR